MGPRFSPKAPSSKGGSSCPGSWPSRLSSLVLGVPAFAQRTTGDIIGTVKDDTGAILPGVVVSVSGPNIAGAQTGVTSGSGVYRIGNLPPGTYDVAFTLTGFKTLTLRGVRVTVGSTVEENVTLGVTQRSEQVEVMAEGAVVDTTSTEVGTTFSNEWIKAAPTRRFGFYDLVAHAPGSVKGGDGMRAGPWSSAAPSTRTPSSSMA